MKTLIIIVWCITFGCVTISSATTVKGKVVSSGNPIPSVQVTDGKSIVLTDKRGNFTLETFSGSKYIYYSLPSGYNSPLENGIPVFYEKINNNSLIQRVNFELEKSKVSQYKHVFILWADPQIQKLEEFDKLKIVVEDVNKTIATIPSRVPVHAICAGDLVFDKLSFFEKYKQVISALKVPFYQVIGNHDLDYNNRSDEFSDKSFSDAFGPSHFSFNVGKIHYVVLKNVFYYGLSRRYIGYIDENQLQWLENDLHFLKPRSTLIVSLHIPTVYGESQKPESFLVEMSNSLLNREALYKIFEPFNTHILAGHSHTQWHTQVKPNIMEHVHAAASGAWWKGQICTDGSPQAYTVYEVNGDSVNWYFKGVNLNKSEQFKVYKTGADSLLPDCFLANVYNFDSDWKVYWYEGDILQGEMERYWGKDPDAFMLYRPGVARKNSWINASETNHLFKAVPHIKNSKIRVEVIDRFGNKYSKELE